MVRPSIITAWRTRPYSSTRFIPHPSLQNAKARVALTEALRGDKTIQEIATKHKVHPNQVSTWKRQAIDGLGDVFSGGADRARSDHGSEIKELHAKIGELTVVNDFLARGLKR